MDLQFEALNLKDEYDEPQCGHSNDQDDEE